MSRVRREELGGGLDKEADDKRAVGFCAFQDEFIRNFRKVFVGVLVPNVYP